MSFVLDRVGRFLARYLEKPVQGYEPFTPSDPAALRATLQPGDVLLVEGNNHVSGIIKYLTQSTWSHAALYVGRIGDRDDRRRRAAGAGGGQSRRRRRRRAAFEIYRAFTPASAGRPA